jgi:hypothetical protein
MIGDKCNIVHGWSGDGVRCIREKGHDGQCWSRAMPDQKNGTVTRVYWLSENGRFKSHSHYDTKYPTNMRKDRP